MDHALPQDVNSVNDSSSACIDVELGVIGADYGANGYTTAAQARYLSERLGLKSDWRLLDIGTGRGWPGLYLARLTGCEVVMTDLAIAALDLARQRARIEGAAAWAVAADAADLPFASASFDAIVQTDVLC